MGLMDRIKKGIGTNDNYDDYEDDYGYDDDYNLMFLYFHKFLKPNQ